VPPRPPEVDGQKEVVSFQTNMFPHPDPEFKASGQKCSVIFKKYLDNSVTYEILGPITARAIGTRLNKYGKEVPEKYVWIDPRTGEQIVRRGNGQYTPIGTRLRGFMTKMKVAKSNQWDTWIDRDFIVGGADALGNDNPWGE
jgi:hypothetical protein